MRPTDAEFVKFTLRAVTEIATKQSGFLDPYTIKRIDKANKILDAEQKKKPIGYRQGAPK